MATSAMKAAPAPASAERQLAGRPHGEHDRQGLHRLDRAGEENRDRKPERLATHALLL